MFKSTMKIEGMACSMCEAHINDLIRKHCKVNKIKSSASKGKTVAADRVPYEKKRFFGKRTRSF